MRASLKNYLDAARRRKEETGESGFSLIELIVVVVILGILAAIAVPVFLGLQAQAEESALESIVANGASQVASDIAQGKDLATITANLTSLQNQSTGQLSGIALTLTPTSGVQIDNYCVSGITTAIATAKTSGPGCP